MGQKQELISAEGEQLQQLKEPLAPDIVIPIAETVLITERPYPRPCHFGAHRRRHAGAFLRVAHQDGAMGEAPAKQLIDDQQDRQRRPACVIIAKPLRELRQLRTCHQLSVSWRREREELRTSIPTN